MAIVESDPDRRWDPGPLVGRVDHDCEWLRGYPHCMGSAAGDASHCTCTCLSSTKHLAAEQSAWVAHQRRRGKPCADCFFAADKLEHGFYMKQMAEKAEPHYCHVFMPVSGVGGVPQRDCYVPRDERLYPLCVGWQKARARQLRMRKHLEIIK
jgi:hypothetical protein